MRPKDGRITWPGEVTAEGTLTLAAVERRLRALGLEEPDIDRALALLIETREAVQEMGRRWPTDHRRLS